MDTAAREHYTPEEVALVTRLKVFINMRWFAVIGTLIAVILASMVFKVSFPTLPVYIICAILAGYNLLFLYQVQSLEKKGTNIIQSARAFGNFHFFLDLLVLTVLLHFTGGIENPFIFYFVFHVAAASIALHYRVVYTLATSAIIIVLLLVGLEYFGVIPHVNLAGFASPTLYREPGYIVAILASLATLLFATAYMVTAISGELRKRQRQVMELREQLLVQKTGELEQASKEIAKLAEERKRFLLFVGVAAHDLKAPLTAVQGYLWVMLGGYVGELNEKQRGMIERSTVRIKELLGLISNLLDIPRIETGQMAQEMKEEVSLLDIIKSCCEDVRKAVEDKGLELRVELPQSLPTIRGAAPRLQQVMNNLLDNAIRYTSEGAVTVRVQEGEKDIKVEVMDTGMGILAEDLPRVFNDFFRGSNVETKGTGLGLAIARRIITGHGGRIWLDSPCPETGKGCRFTFTLPRRPVPAS